MRSAQEILFRLRQEAGNLLLYWTPPRTAPQVKPLPLPDPERIAQRLQGTAFAKRLEALAETIVAGTVTLLGYQIETGPGIRWRRDSIHGKETDLVYFRRIPYLDFDRVGDHKIIWELNRHQHLAALAQAHVLSGDDKALEELFAQLSSWLDQNPVCAGINWTSALEVAFRALSWIWIQHLVGGKMPPKLASRWQLSLFHHGCYLERNLSIYFSPNTHLQGEALALHALGLMFGVERWRQTGALLMRTMIAEHVEPDGGHFEQSSYYHVYSTDMFLFHAVLEEPGADYREGLKRMARYLWALAGSGALPFFGDDDGGRLFYPFGERAHFARGTLAACAAFLGGTPSFGEARDLEELGIWWLGETAHTEEPAPRQSELYPASGMAALVGDGVELLASVRAFGRGSAGHSHAHCLHFTLRHGGVDVLIDPGTYTYVSDAAWREYFRGTAAHNTIRIDGLNQADSAGPFRWENVPAWGIVDWQAQPWRLHGFCQARGVRHERRIFYSDGAVWVIDDITGEGHHRVEQFWHPAGPVRRLADGSIRLPGGMRFIVPEGQTVAIEDGWRSTVPGRKDAVPVLRIEMAASLPCRMIAAFDAREDSGGIIVKEDRLELGDRTLRLPELSPNQLK